MKIPIIKQLDKVIGFLFVSLFPKPKRVPRYTSPTIKSILIIRPGGIGDAILLVTLIRNLKQQVPNVYITVLMEKRNSGVCSLIPEIDAVLHYDYPSELLKAVLGIYDVVIDTEQWYRLSAVMARVVEAPLKIGFATNERSRMFTHTVSYQQDVYEINSYLQLLAPLRIEPAEITGDFLVVSLTAEIFADSLFVEVSDQQMVVIFPGASIAERRWGATRFRSVAESLHSLGIKVVVVGGGGDWSIGEEICTGNIGINLAGQTTLAETAAVIQKSSLLLSGDSGVLHIAVGLNVPTVSLFGPGRAKKWAPRGERHIVINKELPCSPCTTFGTTPPCPINAKCMSDISVEEVFKAVMTLLARTGNISGDVLKKPAKKI